MISFWRIGNQIRSASINVERDRAKFSAWLGAIRDLDPLSSQMDFHKLPPPGAIQTDVGYLYLASPFEKGDRGGLPVAAHLTPCKYFAPVNPSRPPFEKGGDKYHITLNRTRHRLLSARVSAGPSPSRAKIVVVAMRVAR